MEKRAFFFWNLSLFHQMEENLLHKCHPKQSQKNQICVYCLCFMCSNKVYWGKGRTHGIMAVWWEGWYAEGNRGAEYKSGKEASTTHELGIICQKKGICVDFLCPPLGGGWGVGHTRRFHPRWQQGHRGMESTKWGIPIVSPDSLETIENRPEAYDLVSVCL